MGDEGEGSGGGEGEGSGDKGGGKRGLGTPLSTPTIQVCNEFLVVPKIDFPTNFLLQTESP